MSNTATIENNIQPSRIDVYQQVTNVIIEQLEKGVIPWQQSWKGDNTLIGLPKNSVTGKKYQGINIVLLWCASYMHSYNSAEWATFKQWQDKKESIRKGEKGNLIVYYDTFEKEVDGEVKEIPFLKTSVVFNRCQLASYVHTPPVVTDEVGSLVEKIEPLDDFIGNLDALIVHRNGGACYMPSTDTVYMPFPEMFQNTPTCTATEGYYSTLLHELVHWTGKSTRMNRNGGKKFGDKGYANEELVAELGAAFLCGDFGIATTDKGDHAAYIDHWLKVLKDNKHCLIAAASEASKAVKYMNDLAIFTNGA